MTDYKMKYRIIYSADLHGNLEQYEKLIDYSIKNKADAIIVGGDIAPKNIPGNKIRAQRDFYETFPKLLAPLKSTNSKFYLMMGNDDYACNFDVLRKYDHVLQTTDLIDATRELKQRISATGSELMYFASISNAFATKLTALISLMEKHGLTDTNSRYQKYVEARNKSLNNITKPLLAEYSKRAHQVNKTIIENKISYWTYLFYADAYFAEVTYKELRK